MMSDDVYEFTRILCQSLNNGFSLKETFNNLQKFKTINKKITEGAKEIFFYLNKGSSFSNSVKNCSSIKFPKIYSSFIAVSEQTGKIKETLEFLLQQEETKIKAKKDFLSASLYPFIVMILSFAGGVVLQRFSYLFPDTSCNENSFIYANVYLISFCSLIVYITGKSICDNTEYIFFKAMAFLISSGIDLISSLEICILIVPQNSKWEKKIIYAIDELSSGSSIDKAFCVFGKLSAQIFEMEKNNGQMEKAFLQLSDYEEKRKKYLIKNLFTVLEPVMLIGAASYLLILVKEIVIPVLFNYENLFV